MLTDKYYALDNWRNTGKCALVLIDFMWASNVQDEIDQWLALNQGRREGMIIDFDSPEAMALFVLRWN